MHGSVTYSGVLCTNTSCTMPGSFSSCTFSTCPWWWVITSTGKVTNGHSYQYKTLRRAVVVRGENVGADGSSWSRFYDNDTTSCLNIADQTFVTNVATKGNLCLSNGGAITGANTVVDVGGNVVITGPDSSSGAKSPSAGTGWTNPTNVYTSNNVYATNAIATNATGSNQDTTGFGFAIPCHRLDPGDHRHGGALCERLLQRGADDHGRPAARRAARSSSTRRRRAAAPIDYGRRSPTTRAPPRCRPPS